MHVALRVTGILMLLFSVAALLERDWAQAAYFMASAALLETQLVNLRLGDRR